MPTKLPQSHQTSPEDDDVRARVEARVAQQGSSMRSQPNTSFLQGLKDRAEEVRQARSQPQQSYQQDPLAPVLQNDPPRKPRKGGIFIKVLTIVLMTAIGAGGMYISASEFIGLPNMVQASIFNTLPMLHVEIAGLYLMMLIVGFVSIFKE